MTLKLVGNYFNCYYYRRKIGFVVLKQISNVTQYSAVSEEFKKTHAQYPLKITCNKAHN